MMLRIHHSHSKPSAGLSALLAAVWSGALNLCPISNTQITGGHRSRFSDCYLFLLQLREPVGGIYEYFSNKGGGLLQVTA
jgi:hypothetical protein